MTVLFICHDTGNTNVLLRTANLFMQKSPETPIKFLIVGNAAKKVLTNPINAQHAHNLILLSDWLPSTLDQLEKRALTEEELAIIDSKLKSLHVTKAIAGCSCWEEATAPFQIAKKLTEVLSINNNFIYNGEFLHDKEHNPYWSQVKNSWMSQLNVLVAFPKARELSLKENANLNISVVGNSALEDMFDAQPSAEQREKFRTPLNIAADQQLLFISASKFIKDDIDLLNSLYQSLKQQPGTTVCIGLHPGTDNLNQYVSQMIHWLNTHPDISAHIIVTDFLRGKMDQSILRDPHIKILDLSGDNLLVAADAVAAPQPTTLATQGIIQKKPVMVLSHYKDLSYVGSFFASAENVNKTGESVSREKLGLPNENAAEVIYKIVKG